MENKLVEQELKRHCSKKQATAKWDSLQYCLQPMDQNTLPFMLLFLTITVFLDLTLAL